jgi:hypothetical protein
MSPKRHQKKSRKILSPKAPQELKVTKKSQRIFLPDDSAATELLLGGVVVEMWF